MTQHEPLYRQALMSLMWNETYYRWDGTSSIDPGYAGQIDAHNLLILPDKWESPWPLSWESAFEAVTASLVDPVLAENQLRFFLSDQWQQPDGHIPCGEWAMDAECPPIFAWAAWRVYEQSHDIDFLQAIYPGLRANYDYWWSHNVVGDSLFGGGALGMDNLPRGGPGTAQADATAWMALFARGMARIASEVHDTPGSERYWVDRGTIQEALNTSLWDDTTGFYYDQDGRRQPDQRQVLQRPDPAHCRRRAARASAAHPGGAARRTPVHVAWRHPFAVGRLARLPAGHGRLRRELELAGSGLAAHQLPPRPGAPGGRPGTGRGDPDAGRGQRRG